MSTSFSRSKTTKRDASSGFPCSASGHHIGRPRIVVVSGMPLRLVGFNGRYEIDWNNGQACVYERIHNTYLGIQLKPSRIVLHEPSESFQLEAESVESFIKEKDASFYKNLKLAQSRQSSWHPGT